jgi:fructokinase
MILVCGEALVDVFVGRAEQSTFPATIVPGGSPFNVAIGLARLGAPAGYLGGLSTDCFGAHLAAMLEREGASLEFARRLAAPTTLSIVATDETGSPRYSFHGEGAADRLLRPADLPKVLPDDVSALTFGSYSIAVEPTGSTLLELARRERGRRVISLDPNVRPGIVGDLAAWRARFEQFLACASIVKASEEDIALGWGEGANPASLARSWLEKGATLVVLTRGGEGAIAYARSGDVARRGRPVAVVDTVGAGDTFHAALLARLRSRGLRSPSALASLTPDALADVIDYAVSASSITCARKGADLPRAAEVDDVMRKDRPA